MIPIIEEEDFDTVLSEMSRIGFIGNYEIFIRTDDPGKYPHFHIWDRETRGQKFHTCVRLDDAKYFHHTGKEGVLNSKERKSLVAFLKLKHKYLEISNWMYLINEWNNNNSDVELDMNLLMPDYLNLKD